MKRILSGVPPLLFLAMVLTLSIAAAIGARRTRYRH